MAIIVKSKKVKVKVKVKVKKCYLCTEFRKKHKINHGNSKDERCFG